MKRRQLQLRVRIMAIVALIIVAVLIFLLMGTKNPFRRTFQLRTFMDDSSGMTENAPVRLNGISVGDVEALKLSGSKDPHRIVEVDMEIRSRDVRERRILKKGADPDILLCRLNPKPSKDEKPSLPASNDLGGDVTNL